MIYFKAVCSVHQWESSLFLTRSAAVRSARTHRNNSAGPHDISILEVYIPAASLQLRSSNKL